MLPCFTTPTDDRPVPGDYIPIVLLLPHRPPLSSLLTASSDSRSQYADTTLRTFGFYYSGLSAKVPMTAAPCQRHMVPRRKKRRRCDENQRQTGGH